jgi:D-inositol-3-phosphate glycosyltransferase
MLTESTMSDNKTRIAILSVHSSPLGQPGSGDTGGMSTYIRELTLELVKLGHTVDIYTRLEDTRDPEIIELAPDVRLIHIQAGPPADIDKLLIYSHLPDFACHTENFRKLHNLQYDLIFSHYWLSGIAGQYLQTWWQVPQMIMFHTLGAVKNAIGIGEDESDLRLEEEEQAANSSQRVIAATDRDKSALIRYYQVPPEKISVIPCGVNLALFRPIDKSLARQSLGLKDGPIILFVGRVERLKGIDSIIRSLPYLSDIQPELIIVGEDGNRPGEINNLKHLAESLGVSHSVRFTGLVDYERLPYFYNSADVCVFPSYYESFGLVPLESLACGIPVVATDVGDLKNIVRQGETGYIIPSQEPRLISEKVKIILKGKPDTMENPFVIRSTVSHLAWQYTAASISREIKRLITDNAALARYI